MKKSLYIFGCVIEPCVKILANLTTFLKLSFFLFFGDFKYKKSLNLQQCFSKVSQLDENPQKKKEKKRLIGVKG